MLTPASHNQEIVHAQAGTTLRSDNFESLMALYEWSAAGDERERFATALLTRLQSGRGFGRVAYFIVLVLWKIGRLDQALATAIPGLPSGDQKEFGLSNSYLMLTGMLWHKHPDFTPEALDAIESALRQTAEHPFQPSPEDCRRSRTPNHRANLMARSTRRQAVISGFCATLPDAAQLGLHERRLHS